MANEAGAGCVDRASTLYGYTIISNVAASQSGNCDRLAEYITGVGERDFIFAFFTRSGNDFTTVAGTRVVSSAVEPTGCEERSAPGDFTAFSVSSGDYLGAYYVRSSDFTSSGGTGLWTLAGDQTDISAVTFAEQATWLDALTADITAGGGGAVKELLVGACGMDGGSMGGGLNPMYG